MYKLLIPLILTTLLTAGCKEPVETTEPVRPVRVFKTSSKENPELRILPGEVKASREVSLAFRVPGQIIRLNVKEGDLVEKGQLIAMLDQRDFQAAVADLEAKLAGARSVLKEASLNIARKTKLLKDKIIAQSSYDAAQSTYETSKAKVRSLEQSLRRARLNLQYTRLEAPFSGTIAMKHVDNHEYIQAKETIVELEDSSSLDIVLDVPESVWVRAFNKGRPAWKSIHARFESFPERIFPLEIKEFQTNINPATQTYKVTMTMAAPQGTGIHPGMTAEVVGTLPEKDGKAPVSIPCEAVAGTPDGEKFVWVLSKDGTVCKRIVEVGRIMNDMFLVRDGIIRGETIVAAGVNYLREGQKVKVLRGRIGGRE